MRHQRVWFLVVCLALAGAFPALGQIQFRDGSTVIPDGSVHDFGTTLVGVDLTQRITLVNVGSTPITVGQAVVSSNANDPGSFSTSNLDLGTLNPGDTGGFDAIYGSTGPGTVTNEIAVTVNGVRAYRFDARATATEPVGPVIQLKQGSATVHRNDLVNFGTTTQGLPVNKIFTVTNVGDQSLTLGTIGFGGGASNPILFTAPSNNVQNLAPNASATFTLRFTASQVATVTNRVRLFVNGSSNFEFDVRGTANPPPAADLVVMRSGVTIQPGSSTHLGTTDFGEEILETITLLNMGNATLTVQSVTWTGTEVSFATSAPTSVPAGQNRTFTLRFSGATEGPRSSVLSIATNDPTPDPYSFTANWTVTDAVGAIIELRHNGVLVPRTSTFDFGDTGVGQEIVRTFTATNTGDQPLTIGSISISSNTNDPAAFHAQNNQVVDVAPGGSGTFQIRFDAAALGSVTRAVRLFEGGTPRHTFFALAETKAPTYALDVSPSSHSVQVGESAIYTVSVNGQFGFDSNVALSLSGLPSNTTHSFTPVTVPAGGTAALQVNTTASTPLATSTLTITGSGGGLSKTATAQLQVSDTEDFVLDITPFSRTTQQGGAVHYTISVDPVDGFDSDVSLSLTGLPEGTTHTFDPVTVTPGDTSLLVLRTTSSTPLGDHRMVVRGAGGGITRAHSARLIVNDDPAAGPPVIDDVAPNTIVHGGIRTITLTGANFQGATVSVPDEAPDPDEPMTRWFPTVSVESINAAGTRMVVRVDARDTRILDFYNLLVDNGQGEEAAFFRVLPAGPLVDTWTPAEPERDKTYVLSLVGHNLRNATVSPSRSGRVRIFGVDNGRDDRLNAIMQVEPGAPLGPLDLVVRDPSGHSVSLPITIQPAGVSRLLSRDLVAQQQDPQGPQGGLTGSGRPRGGQGAGEAPRPELFFQDFVMRRTQGTVMDREDVVVQHPALVPSGEDHARGALASDETADMINFDFFIRVRVNLVNFHWQVGLIFDPETGQVGDAILQGLDLGDRINIGAFVLSFYLRVDMNVYFRIGSQGWSFPLFCLEITTGLEIPGLGGLAYFYDFCRGGGSGNATNGSTNTLEVTGGPCAEVTSTGPPSEGVVYAEVEQDECCEQPIGVAGTGSTFTGLPFARPNWSVNNPNAGTSTPGGTCGQPSCAVEITDPPACISQSRRRTFSASGNPSGGTYEWRIAQAASKASIQGAPNQSDVSVRGDVTSDMADDVELEVTYSVGGISCTESVDLSVIEVDLTWRGSGMQDPRNDPPGIRATAVGLPTLGAVSLGNPSGAQGWFKNMEIKGRVTPCDPTLRCKFDFKRNREGTVGYRQVVNEVPIFSPIPSHDCPLGGCDDDRTNDDEDLILDPGPSCGIFALDTPGFFNTRCSSAQASRVLINCLSFDEWLNVDDERASETVKWYASTRLFCDGSSWSESVLGQGNRLSTGILDCSRQAALPLGPPLPSVDGPIHSVGAIYNGLTSSDESLRMVAGVNALAWDASGTLEGHSRDELIGTLVQIAGWRSGFDGDHVALSPPLQAIRLLGALRATEGISVLISRIEDDFPRIDVGPLDDVTPAVVALSKIGPAAIDPILDRASVASESEWVKLTAALRRMEDPADLEKALEGRMMTASGPEMKRLEELMSE
ncbi:MAG: choice-of-anchor D domain-containing protein [Acidobacteriota bacterium]